MKSLRSLFKRKCQHPLEHLRVYKHQTAEPEGDDGLFILHTYHLQCFKCGKRVEIQHVKPTEKYYAPLKRVARSLGIVFPGEEQSETKQREADHTGE